MNKNYLIAIVLLVLVGGAAYLFYGQPATPVSDKTDEQLVRELVAEIGSKVNNVTLSDSREVVIKAIQDNYGPFFSADLMAAFEKEPIKAPGRLNAQSLVKGIDILEMSLDEEGAYEVQGKIGDVANLGAGTTLEYGVAMKFRKQDGRWVMTGFSKAVPSAL